MASASAFVLGSSEFYLPKEIDEMSTRMLKSKAPEIVMKYIIEPYQEIAK